MIKKVKISEFMVLAATHPVIDVRTPYEFTQGHMPGSHNIPLFSNEERVVIGTAYKQQGREAAILIGLDYIGPHMRTLIERVRDLFPDKKTILVHCWRGGMRSGSFALLLQLFGYEIFVLEGGYKAYRALAQTVFEQPRKLIVIGGQTGSGKTELLKRLAQSGEQVIDLEQLACHKGSVFGGLGVSAQPTQEQFENELAYAWIQHKQASPLYIEDESKKIGAVFVPETLWRLMRAAPIINLHVPRENRLARLRLEYGSHTYEQLQECARRLEKQLGGLATQQIVTADVPTASDLLLHYYDKSYAHGLSKRDSHLTTNFAFNGELGVVAVKNVKALAEKILCI
jgi:tRNA 2-selenouridine synthase